MPEKFFRYKMRKAVFLWMILGLLMFFSRAGTWAAEIKKEEKKENKKTEVVETKIDLDQMVVDEDPSGMSPQEVVFNEQKLMQISQALKNAIEENKELMKDKEKIIDDVKQLRGQHEVDASRMNALSQERDEIKRRIEEAVKTNQEQTQKSKELQTSLDQKTQVWEAKVKKLEEQLALQEKLNEDMETMRTPALSEEDAASDLPGGAGGLTMVSKVQQLNQENDQLRSESAKVHYNLGNIFFKQGEYDRAAVEYRQAVQLMPYDPANHYNLAFVSGDFLNDHRTALKHYQQYLFLNPKAKDAAFVKEKILKARMELKAAINSPLEEKTKINDNF